MREEAELREENTPGYGVWRSTFPTTFSSHDSRSFMHCSMLGAEMALIRRSAVKRASEGALLFDVAGDGDVEVCVVDESFSADAARVDKASCLSISEKRRAISTSTRKVRRMLYRAKRTPV